MIYIFHDIRAGKCPIRFTYRDTEECLFSDRNQKQNRELVELFSFVNKNKSTKKENNVTKKFDVNCTRNIVRLLYTLLMGITA